MKTEEIGQLEAKAVTYMHGEYHCSEATVKALAERYNIDSHILLKIANPFGGGIGDSDNLCGAVSGAIMLIGLLVTPPEKKPNSWPSGMVAKEFMNRFDQEIGTTNCTAIRKGLHWSKAQKYCDEALKTAVRIAAELLDQHLSTSTT